MSRDLAVAERPKTVAAPKGAAFSVGELQAMAETVAASRLFPGITSAQAAFTLMLVCQSEGLHPAQALKTYHIIEGRPAKRADAMLADFLKAGGSVRWIERTDQCVSAEFAHPQGGSVVVDWDMRRAKQAGLAGKGTWNKYPRQMLTARVISEGVRTVYPGVVTGFYTPEEVEDFEPARPAAPAPAPRPAPAQAPHYSAWCETTAKFLDIPIYRLNNHLHRWAAEHPDPEIGDLAQTGPNPTNQEKLNAMSRVFTLDRDAVRAEARRYREQLRAPASDPAEADAEVVEPYDDLPADAPEETEPRRQREPGED